VKKRIIVFASGSGSNAEKIAAFFNNDEVAEVVGILSNNANAGVLERANQCSLPTWVFSNDAVESGEEIVALCRQLKVDLIVLAGFLRKIPHNLLYAYSNRIVNIHPSLLPKYGGKGMYGHYVHEKVSQNGDDISGISIHLVNEKYDDGAILAQYSCPIVPHENPVLIAQKVLQLEHLYYPPTIKNYIESL
jgi:phosphoribosylglycinamide formyltransferase-1